MAHLPAVPAGTRHGAEACSGTLLQHRPPCRATAARHRPAGALSPPHRQLAVAGTRPACLPANSISSATPLIPQRRWQHTWEPKQATRSVRARASGPERQGGQPGAKPKQPLDRQSRDRLNIYSIAGALTLAVALALTAGRGALEDWLLDSDVLYDTLGGLTLGDACGAALWGCALWFLAPWHLLLLFLGRIDTERPSDWLLREGGRALGLPVDTVEYTPPGALVTAVALSCVGGGLAAAYLFRAALGDATWSVSTGLGACMAAGVYEVGRPKRLSVEEAQLLETQWQVFAAFAEERLQRRGQCHESEVFSAFRQAHARYRSADALPDPALRDMVRNWHRGVQRTAGGYLKGLSLRPRIDPFTGQQSGLEYPPRAGASALEGVERTV